MLYLTAGWAGTDRTVGKSVMGLRVVTNRGQPLRPRRAFLRALICATLGAIALAWVVVSRRRAGIHDIVVRTTVVYDWTTTPSVVSASPGVAAGTLRATKGDDHGH